MTQTSLWGGRIKFAGSNYDDDEAFDTAVARMLVNNANHLADECAQVRIAFPPTDGPNGGISRDLPDGKIHEVISWPLPLAVRDDGNGYVLRCRLHARISQGADTIAYGVRVGPTGLAIFGDIGGDDSYAMVFTTSSTTSAWLTPTGNTEIYIPRSLVAASMTSASTVDSVGGSSVGVRWAYMTCTIIAQRTSGSTADASVSGFYLAEYVGLT